MLTLAKSWPFSMRVSSVEPPPMSMSVPRSIARSQVAPTKPKWASSRADSSAMGMPMASCRAATASARVLAVAQHGGGEHVDALAAEVPRAFQVALEHRCCALNACLHKRAVFHVGGQPRHDLVVHETAEVLVRVGGLTVVFDLVDDEAHRVRSQIDDAVVGHGQIPFSLTAARRWAGSGGAVRAADGLRSRRPAWRHARRWTGCAAAWARRPAWHDPAHSREMRPPCPANARKRQQDFTCL